MRIKFAKTNQRLDDELEQMKQRMDRIYDRVWDHQQALEMMVKEKENAS